MTIARFMTDPQAMRDMAHKFDMHAQNVRDESHKMFMSSMDIAGAGWSGTAQLTSHDTMEQMNQAFRNIVTLLEDVRDQLGTAADRYEHQEETSKQILSGS
ncbi:WXG100 family type VII secretion target [Mycobacterium lepromatosis]|uniref:ESAT-6-like protein n=1 Tax=Mycobacterium lepromatosis TaxID=480418 RepID=A0A0F4ER18_9MYCO|nr:WXG100 family type VII secretion target [Mycobacterium lepromatosis]KJX75338.1 ESAT-6 like protein EsxK1 [Mycobacterium lepromatosis]